MSLSDAMRTASDPSASPSERRDAIFALGESGSAQAVRLLEQIVAEEEENEASSLSRSALLALGGFAGTPAAGPAQTALQRIEVLEVGDPVDRVQAEAVYEPNSFLDAFRAANDTLLRKDLVYAAGGSLEGDALTSFYLEALGDRSMTVRTITTYALSLAGDRVDDGLVTAALEQVAASDPSAEVRRAAEGTLRIREYGVPTYEHPSDPPPDDGGRGRRDDPTGGVSVGPSG
jgi:HEAT repeat protein